MKNRVTGKGRGSFPAKLSVSADTLYTRKSLSRPCFVLPFPAFSSLPFRTTLGESLLVTIYLASKTYV